MHFEVHKVVPTATVSKTSGARKATVCVDNAIGTGFNCVPVDPYGWCALTLGSETPFVNPAATHDSGSVSYTHLTLPTTPYV